MVVVVGGVGSIGGTIISAFGIGGIDQVLQQYLPVVAPGLGWVPGIGGFLQNLAQDAAVFGKILVLAGIILFLQRKPAGCSSRVAAASRTEPMNAPFPPCHSERSEESRRICETETRLEYPNGFFAALRMTAMKGGTA